MFYNVMIVIFNKSYRLPRGIWLEIATSISARSTQVFPKPFILVLATMAEISLG